MSEIDPQHRREIEQLLGLAPGEPPDGERVNFDRPTVLVVCAESSHEPRVAQIGRFEVHMPEDDSYEYGIVEQRWTGPALHPDGRRRRPSERPARRQVNHSQNRFDDDKNGRYRFECPLCSLTVVALGSKVDDAFVRLAESGVSRVTLHGLATILK